jgi:fructose-1-phosphate kinase PfkB-like protein
MERQQQLPAELFLGKQNSLETDCDDVSSHPHSLEGGVMVVGLNPALQKRFILGPQHATLIPGDVHRAHRVDEGIGGKGQDVAVAFSCLLCDSNDSIDHTMTEMSTTNSTTASTTSATKKMSRSQPPLFLLQLVSKGPEGDTLLQLLEKHIRSHVPLDYRRFAFSTATTVRTRSKLRVCTTIVASDSATELVEPAGFIERDEVQELLNKVNQLGKTSSSSMENLRATLFAFCIMGSMPPGCPLHTYATLAKLTVGPETLVVIDSVVGLDLLLKELALVGIQHAMLKINLSELSSLVNLIPKPSDLWTIAHSFLDQYPDATNALSHIAITNGKEDAFLISLKRMSTHLLDTVDTVSSTKMAGDDRVQAIWTIPVPKLPEQSLAFPIGAGDAVSAGILASWMHFKRSSLRLHEELCTTLNSAILDPSMGGEAASVFSFGLACGSASCLRPENSVFDVKDAIQLFSTMAKPTQLNII